MDNGSFLLALVTLGMGGAVGYVASEEGVLKHVRQQGLMERQSATDSTVQTSGTTAAPPAIPVVACDDITGAPGPCPAPGEPEAEEESCGAYATKRCQDFKQAMKPRVAERAVACLNALTPAQRCDPARVNLCGHGALMNACSPPEAPQAIPNALATPAANDELGSTCDSILRGCTGTTLAPTVRECRETLAGLNAMGRDKMAACMSTHCGDKGLMGCEAL